MNCPLKQIYKAKLAQWYWKILVRCPWEWAHWASMSSESGLRSDLSQSLEYTSNECIVWKKLTLFNSQEVFPFKLTGLNNTASLSCELSSSLIPMPVLGSVFLFEFELFPLFFFLEIRFPALVGVMLCEAIVCALAVMAMAWVSEGLAVAIVGHVMDSKPAAEPWSVLCSSPNSFKFLPTVVLDLSWESTLEANVSYLLELKGRINNLP